jgi:hypothetical protein
MVKKIKRFVAKKLALGYGIFDLESQSFVKPYRFKHKYVASLYIDEHEQSIINYINKVGVDL